MGTKSTLVKTIKTGNHAFVLKLFHKYNSDDYLNLFATTTKMKGGDNLFYYIINVYKIERSNAK